MLQQIELQFFKCFALLKLPVGPLTLLSGANASGKSSVMQALVLLHQTIRDHQWSTRLMLNGTSIRLGTASAVIDDVFGRRTCAIALLDSDTAYEWDFAGDRDEMSMAVDRVRANGSSEEHPNALRDLLPVTFDDRRGTVSLASRLRGLTYLTAERLGPREHYALEDPQLTPVVGPTGEHAASVLYSGGDLPVLHSLAVPDVPPTRLRQVGARMEQFFPGCALTVEKVPRASAVALGFRTSSATEFHAPVHTGFGLTQVFPIVVAALSVGREDLLLIENPEVHLHPAGQARMGEFLAEVAAAGVQVMLETHSDHVLNGVRRAVKNGALAPGDVALHFFRPRHDAERDGVAQVQSPYLDGDGNVDDWPDGFFDQFDKDMSYFAGWS